MSLKTNVFFFFFSFALTACPPENEKEIEDTNPPADTACDDPETYYQDADGDGFGNMYHDTEGLTPLEACVQPEGYVENNTDCDDSDATINPDATEIWGDGVTQSCLENACVDDDMDGYRTGIDCEESADQDCDDTDSSVYPGGREVCNYIDDDCDGEIDENAYDASMWYLDSDNDIYGDPIVFEISCDAPEGYVTDHTDCVDTDPAIHPGASEYCNDLDDNCDGEVDEEAVDAPTWWYDQDGDNYGRAIEYDGVICDEPFGYTDNNSDCNDADDSIHPGAEEWCQDNTDTDCDGIDSPVEVGCE